MKIGQRTVVRESRRARVPYPQPVEPLQDRPECTKCEGTGKRGGKRQALRNHKPDCACITCKPCIACGGIGRTAAARVRPTKEVDVVDSRFGDQDDEEE